MSANSYTTSRDLTPSLGTEAVEGGWGGRELVESVYGPLTEFYERLDARLREVPEDVPAFSDVDVEIVELASDGAAGARLPGVGR